ncbi:monovalent cation/H+ antiporter subunit E [Natronobacterium gregoryi]|uniref:Cation:proton antiporter n=2 Tax=Natronobacterium gregoryi TaxID=44930 RepID=L0AMC9_NATGS|nr:monovalent cation/H+ antiporter subunit E [Natronobacterium gregoryi]AFZ74200.1 multisubunit Na+/H+ antiporter, MnhE subunit [Natronobacterium gregoryi SP2]ELY63655.1 monovalent cation/H+ antiporter subunit E [Natronobacterium gregoryi SP2]PLK22010.1 cation:proton antiporter [Natronobacterium gregoryi SP2]SFI51351.1 multisubunit sodium/proton antiporter, MrpE subunit [Natronobacterium gregoryi]
MIDGNGVIVPISPSSTLEETVVYAVDAVERREGASTVHLVLTTPGHHTEDDSLERDRSLLSRMEKHATDASDDTSVRTALLGEDEYFADPLDHFELLLEYVEAHDLERVIVDPAYSVDATAHELQSIETVLADADVHYEVAPVSGGWRPTRDELVRGGVVGVVAFVFYAALGGPTYPFALATGAVTALIVAVLLRNVAFEQTPHIVPGLSIIARGVLFVPYMFWEITKANVQFAYVVLHPSLPIDPCLDRVDAAVGDGLSVTAFANSITLTPGTLTVDTVSNELLVHSLAPSARNDLVEGVHERAVRFLFYGREGLDLPGPDERNDVESIVEPSEPPAELDGGASDD